MLVGEADTRGQGLPMKGLWPHWAPSGFQVKAGSSGSPSSRQKPRGKFAELLDLMCKSEAWGRGAAGEHCPGLGLLA